MRTFTKMHVTTIIFPLDAASQITALSPALRELSPGDLLTSLHQSGTKVLCVSHLPYSSHSILLFHLKQSPTSSTANQMVHRGQVGPSPIMRRNALAPYSQLQRPIIISELITRIIISPSIVAPHPSQGFSKDNVTSRMSTYC